MTNPPDRDRPRGRGPAGPVEPGSALYRLLEMVAEAIARARAGAPPEGAGPPPATSAGEETAAPGPASGPPP